MNYLFDNHNTCKINIISVNLNNIRGKQKMQRRIYLNKNKNVNGPGMIIEIDEGEFA